MRSKVQQYHNTLIGFIAGMSGGVTKFMLTIGNESFTARFFEAIITAFVCGVMGVLGKEVVVYIKKIIKK